MTTTTFAPIIYYTGMSELTSEAQMPTMLISF